MANGPIIFVLDDDVAVLEYIKRILIDDNGYDVHIFDDSKTLLEHVLFNKADLLIIDVSLKDVDGRVLYNDICSVGLDIPVLFVSSTIDNDVFDQLHCDTVYDFMLKPFMSTRFFINKVKLLLKVSSHKKVEEEKERINTLFEAVLEQVPFGIDIIEKNGKWRVVKSSNKAKEITGGIGLEGIEDINADPCIFDVYDNSGNLVSMEELPGIRSFLYDEYIDNEELVIVRKDGSEVYASFKSVPVKDKHGKTIAGLQISFDITKYKLTENSLKLQQTSLRNEIEKRLDSWRKDITRAGISTQSKIRELTGVVDKKIKESIGAK